MTDATIPARLREVQSECQTTRVIARQDDRGFVCLTIADSDDGDAECWLSAEAWGTLCSLGGHMIEPLKQSDDPEEAEAVRVTPDYVLMSRAAADMQAKLHHSWRDERDALREAAADALRDQRRAAEIADELRCDVTVKRCRDFGCADKGAQDVGPDYRCPSCRAYEYLSALRVPPTPPDGDQ